MSNIIFEGAISVKAAILAQKRNVFELIVDKDKKDKNTNFILNEAKRRNIKIRLCSKDEINELASGKTHGGIICYASERKTEKISKYLKDSDAFICVLEGIEDPYNFGYCLRSLYAAGCSAVIVNQRNWSSAADVIAKSSAGASEYIAICSVENMQETLNEVKKAQFQIYCAQRSDAISLYEANFTSKVCLAIGGEMRGLSKVVLEASDQNIYIPYEYDFRNALNASSATSVIAFEIYRQKINRGDL